MREQLPARISAKDTGPSRGILQRKCACGNHTIGGSKCDSCRHEEEQEATDGGQTAPSSVHQTLQSGGGRPFDDQTRKEMEARFGRDFSDVRIHTGTAAARSSQEIDADAYTVGNQIVFGEGRFAPEGADGRSLIAHELAHVVQQQGAPGTNTVGAYVLGEPDAPEEREAESVAAQVSEPSHSQGAPAIRRQITLDDEQRETVADESASEQADSEVEEVLDGDSPSGDLENVSSEAGEAMPKEEEASLVSPHRVRRMAARPIRRQKDKGGSKPAKPAKPAAPPKTIKKITVDLSSQKMTIEWSDGTNSAPITVSTGRGVHTTAELTGGNTVDEPCKHPEIDGSACTPPGNFTVGKKGDAKYKNSKGDAMSWYVEFLSNRGIGIHDSQPVTGKPASHGCVRTDAASARQINQGVTSSTTVEVTGTAPVPALPKPKPKPAPTKKSVKRRTIRRKQGSVLDRKAEPLVVRRASGKEMYEPREDSDEEAQRKEAYNIVTTNRLFIRSEAARFNVAPDAVAGAIFWEALENPYSSLRPASSRLGPGKVHPTEFSGKSEAEKVEEEKRVPASKDTDERRTKLKDAKTAITYIAAIMRRHADNYMTIAGVDISTNVGVLCTLYQGGHSEERARKLAEKRKTDPTALPQPGDEMALWVLKNQVTIHSFVDPGPRPH